MPLYDFRCRACGEAFEAQAPIGASAPCPACGEPEPERLVSGFAGPFLVGRMRGIAGRRADAERRVREEQRQERKAHRREQQDR